MNRLYRERPITWLPERRLVDPLLVRWLLKPPLVRWLLKPLFLLARQAVAGSPINP